MTTNYVGERTNTDPICPLCHKAVETHHMPFRDVITGGIAHDYCYRIETPEHFASRRMKTKGVAVYGPVRWA